MLSYCVNIVFYLLLKAEGRPVRDHPVVLRLVEIRTYLEKLRPVDRKLRYQIDKLVKMADRPRANARRRTRRTLCVPAKPGRAREQGGRGRRGGRRGRRVQTAQDAPHRHGGRVRGGGKSNKEKRKEKRRGERANRSALIKVRGVVRGADGMVFFFLRGSRRVWRGFPRTEPGLHHVCRSLPRSSAAFVGVLFHGDRRRPFFRGTERTYQILGRVPFKSRGRLSNQEMDIFRRFSPSRERPLRCRPPSVSRASALR